MSLEHILGIAPRHSGRPDAMQQFDDIRRDLRRLLRQVGHGAEETATGFGDLAQGFGREAMHQAGQVAGELSRQADRGARAIKRDPLPVIAVIGTAVLLASLLHRKR